jgi:hypothetical protein
MKLKINNKPKIKFNVSFVKQILCHEMLFKLEHYHLNTLIITER